MIILLILNVVIIERILFMPDIILKTKDLTKKYQSKTVVDALNLEVKKGEIFLSCASSPADVLSSPSSAPYSRWAGLSAPRIRGTAYPR